MPLEPPGVLLQGFGPFCLGALFARFGLWIATEMATVGPKHPQEFPWAPGGAWGPLWPSQWQSRGQNEQQVYPSKKGQNPVKVHLAALEA